MYETIEIQPPNHLKLKHNYTSIFLAGSIEIIFNFLANLSYLLIWELNVLGLFGPKKK
jgi:hypothetical protein